MKPMRRVLVLMLVELFLIGVSGALAQQVVVTPQQKTLRSGEGQQFEAQLFDENRRPVLGVTYVWSVEPGPLGSISGDGYFVAGPDEGTGRVIAAVVHAGTVYRGSTEVVIVGGRAGARHLVVEPAQAALAPGESQQFKAYLLTSSGVSITPATLRWDVQPAALGAITGEGLFTAGQLAMSGEVVAQAVLEGRPLRGMARVQVSPSPNGAIAGAVADATGGSPLVGAIVTVQAIGPLAWMARDTTGADGSYLVKVLAPGFYVLRAEARGYVPEYYEDAEYLREATPVYVAPGDTVSDINFALGRGGAITGIVAAEVDSIPLPGAHVQAYRPLLPKVRHHALTNAQGSYVITGLPAGSYVVEAEAAGYQVEFFADAPTMRSATLVSVTESDTTAGVDFFLATSSAITGTVIDGTTGVPIALARVCAHLADASRPQGGASAVACTDSNGTYTLAVRPGTYYVEARAEGYAVQWYEGAAVRRDATPVVVIADQHTQGIDFRLDKLGAVAGLVTDEDAGTPVVEAVVTAYREGPGAESSSVRTDAQGSFVIAGLQPGNYLVRAAAADYLAEWYQEAAVIRDATLVAVAGGDTTEAIDFTLSRGGSISGTVRSQLTGQPLQGARVEVWSTAGPWSRSVFTAEDGTYSITGLASGSYLVQAAAKEHVPVYYDGVFRRSEATPVVVTAPEETAGIDFLLPERLPDGATIAGRVVDEQTGAPLWGVRVFATPLTPGQVRFDLTDGNGAYLLSGLQPGIYVVWAFKRGYLAELYNDAHSWPDATRLTVHAGEQISGIDFALTPQPRGPFTVAGRVMARDGQPVGGAIVVAAQGDVLVASAMSDEDGQFALDELPSGDYALWASLIPEEGSSPALSQTVTLTLTAAKAAQTDVDLMLAPASSNNGEPIGVPESFALVGNFPNPFNPGTQIRFDLPEPADVSLTIFNVLGQPVRTLLKGTLAAGRHSVLWDGADYHGAPVACGVYFCRLEAQAASGARHQFVHKMLLTQ